MARITEYPRSLAGLSEARGNRGGAAGGVEGGGRPMARIPEYPRSLAGLSDALRTGEVSPVEVTEGMLDRIGADRTNAFITVTAERAMEYARRAEAEIAAGRYRGPLHGVPVAIKDLVSTGGVRTTMASAFFEDHVPESDAAVARRLREAGSVLLGKTNTHEFAYGPTGDRSFFGPSRNPHDLARISGGSSGGSGTAVATGLCYGAIGSDTGGSVRIPAALCGVVGMKPTFGRVGKSGVFPLARTLDHVGPLTRTAEDNALFLSVLAGHDPEDLHSVDRPPEDFARDLDRGVEGTTVGIPTTFFFEPVEREVESRVRQAIEVFREVGAEVRAAGGARAG